MRRQDLEISDEIYRQTHGRFASFDKENPDCKTKIFAPFGLEGIADQQNIDADIIFWKAILSPEQKIRLQEKNSTTVSIYTIIQGDAHSVKLPLTALALADLRNENN